jgi:hypothetical protein
MSIFCKIEVLCVSTYLLTTVTGSGDILILVDIKSTSLHKTLITYILIISLLEDNHICVAMVKS